MASGRVRILSGGVRNVKIIREKGGGTLKKGRGTLKKGRGTQKGDEGRKKGRGTLKKGRGTSFSLNKECSSDSDKGTRRRGDKGIVDCGLPAVSSLRSVAIYQISSRQEITGF